MFLTSCAFLSFKPREKFVPWTSFFFLSYQYWAVCTQWLTLFHYLFHLHQCPPYPSLSCFLSFLVCQHIFIIVQSRSVGTQRVKNIRWISSASDINDYINFRRPHLRHKPLARHKMSLVYSLSNPAPSGKRIVVLRKWDS